MQMRILFLVFTSFCFLACKQNKSIEQSTPFKPSDYIQLSRAACFGTCPVYEVQIFANGRVVYEGQRNVLNVGRYSSKLNEEQTKLLFEDLIQLNWSSYPDAYPIDNVDFPQFKLVFQSQALDKSIKANSNAATELIELAKKIDFIISKLEFSPIAE